MKVTINGHEHEFSELQSESNLLHLIELLHLKADRVAVERNGDIVPRANWAEVRLEDGDRLEVVQFVGGGLESGLTKGEPAEVVDFIAVRRI